MAKNLILFLWSGLLAVSTALGAPMDGAPLQKPLPQNLWVEMAKRTNPGVVGIFVEFKQRSKRNRLRRDPLFEILEEMFGESLDFPTPPNRKAQESKPIGTGFIIKKNGLIVTNHHVAEVGNGHQLKVSLPGPDGKHSEFAMARIVGTDKRGDIALLKIETTQKLHVLELGDSQKLEVGEYVAAFGNPFGHSNTMTVGVISAIGRNIKEINRFPFLQTDASINPGNSGGPLLDTNGYVIGVNTAIDARAQGIGFAIPIDYVKGVLPTLERGENVKRGFLGVGLGTLTPRMATELGIPGQQGVYVTEVQPGMPAEKAGVQKGDIITEFNKEKIQRSENLADAVQDSTVGSRASLKVLRLNDQGQPKTLTLNLTLAAYPDQARRRRGSRPSRNAESPPPPTSSKPNSYGSSKAPYDLGFGLTDSSSGARRYYDIPVKTPFGPIVTRVSKKKSAGRAGLRAGDVLLEINGQDALNVKTAMTLIQPSRNIIKVSRKGTPLTIKLR